MPDTRFKKCIYTNNRQMIEYVKGELVDVTPAFAVVDTGGVGYGLNISLNTPHSLVLLAISLLYWPPKSRISIFSKSIIVLNSKQYSINAG